MVYPALKEDNFKLPQPPLDLESIIGCKPERLVMSLNRFERKKNVPLAVKAFAALLESSANPTAYHLVIAGGYDDAVPENVEVYNELTSLAKDLGIPDS